MECTMRGQMKIFLADPKRGSWLALGVCKLQLKHYDDASAAMEAVLKADPKSDLAEDSYLYLGLAHYGAGQAGKTDRYPKAIEALQKMIATFPAGKQTGKGLYYLGDS